MDRHEIFTIAVKDFTDISAKDTVFALVEDTIKSINNANESEKEKKASLNEFFDQIIRSNSKNLYGVKTEELKNVIYFAKNNLNKFNMEEFNYYFSLIVRLNKAKINLKDSIVAEEKLVFENKRRKQEVEKEKLLKEQENIRKEEEKKLSLMSEGEKIAYAIKNEKSATGNLESYITEIYNKIDIFEAEDKIVIAEEIKNYYIKNNKWDGKLSKKQIEKVNKIKQIIVC